ncbi:uncharacterized protein ACIB01_016860 [Guaruba guarouba]
MGRGYRHSPTAEQVALPPSSFLPPPRRVPGKGRGGATGAAGPLRGRGGSGDGAGAGAGAGLERCRSRKGLERCGCGAGPGAWLGAALAPPRRSPGMSSAPLCPCSRAGSGARRSRGHAPPPLQPQRPTQGAHSRSSSSSSSQLWARQGTGMPGSVTPHVGVSVDLLTLISYIGTIELAGRHLEEQGSASQMALPKCKI